MVLGGLNEDRAPGSSRLCLRRKNFISVEGVFICAYKNDVLFAFDGNDVFIRACAYFICAYSFVSVRKD